MSHYDQLIKMTETERAKELSAIQASDPPLADVLIKMFESEKKPQFLQHAPEISIEEIWTQNIKPNFGRYNIIEKVALGGMGRIYKAQLEESDVIIHVALKMIRSELLSDSMFNRFQAEKNILSGLDHPNIAALVDAGVVGDIPYLATAWFDGQPLNRYIKDRGLAINEKLKLFFQVCEAVIYAHGRLVIHRDLKPGNILVNEEGTVKLLDFGIAKMLNESQHDATHTHVFTPDYAAPEQINGQPCTTATDVYALGVLLKELLTESNRFEFEDISIASKIEQILSNEVILASQLAKSNGNLVMAQKLTGPLDKIIAKAMHVDIDRRYQSVAEMMDDLIRYKKHLPIKAMGDGWFYRTRMFWKRNAWSGAFSMLFVMSLLVGMTVSLKQRNEAVMAQQATLIEAEKNQQIVNFFRTMFNQAAPLEGGLANISVQEMLQKGYEDFDFNLIDNPETKAYVASQMGLLFAEFSDFEKQHHLYDLAATAVAADLDNYGSIYLHHANFAASALNDMEQPQAAIEYIEKALELLADIEIDSSKRAESKLHIGSFYMALGQEESALQEFMSVESFSKQHDLDEQLAKSFYYQHILQQDKLSPAESLELLEQARALMIQQPKENINMLFSINNSLALRYKDQGKFRSCIDLLSEVDHEYRNIYGVSSEDHLINLADAHFYVGDFEQVVDLTTRAIAIMQDKQINTGFVYMAALIIQARSLTELRQFIAAEANYQAALQFFNEKFPKDHIAVVTLNGYWIDFIVKSNRGDMPDQQALSQINTSAEQQLNASDRSKHRYVNAKVIAATALWHSGHLAAAEEMLMQAFDQHPMPESSEDWRVSLMIAGIEQLRKDLGKPYDDQIKKLHEQQLFAQIGQDHWYHDFFK